jgi:uncharacterized protein (DUF1330 family)
MPAYILVQVEVQDPESYKRYTNMVPATLAQYGGRFIVRGGKAETLEGDWMPPRMVVAEFSSVEQAKKWWSSPEYAEAKALRQRSAKTQMIVVEGA